MAQAFFPRIRPLLAGAAMLAAPGFLIAQTEPAASTAPMEQREQGSADRGGWRRVDERQPQQDPTLAQRSAYDEAQATPRGPLNQYGEPMARDPRMMAAPPAQIAIPPQLTIRPGTFITVRIDQPLSSGRNQPGDAFGATLVKPVVVDGVVVAERGQTIAGRVVEVEKAGRVQGVSRLGIELTDLSVADGQQLPIQTRLISRAGGTSAGRDAGAIAGTTMAGAAIGGMADWGRGAAIGAGAGAAAGVIGVLLTRGRDTIIYPESVLVFRIEAPVTISTERAPQAFRGVEREDYDRPNELQTRQMPARSLCGPYGCPPPYYAGPGYPYYYGPGLGIYFGSPRYYRGSGFYYGYGRGYHRR